VRTRRPSREGRSLGGASLAAAALAAGLAWGAATPAVAQEAEAATQGCRVLKVGSPQIEGPARRRARLSAREILDVEFQVLVPPGLSGDHVIELRVFTPGGHLYQSLPAPFSADGTSSRRGRLRPRRVRVAGYPRPVAQKELTAGLWRGSRRHALSVRLPVAGTPIVSHSLYGRWTVAAFLDGGSSPCGRARPFQLVP
jgi:hypothetical protein